MRAALYMRRSTNDELQADSLDIQEELLTAFAAANSFIVDAGDVFRESASGRTADGRDEFLRLIESITSRRANFEVVLVRDVSRWGRFDNADESAYYEFLCLRHGVQVVYVEESFGAETSPYASLMKSLKRVLAAEFSREKSRIVSRGKRRTAERGFHPGAPAPYGMRRVLVRPDGSYVQELEAGIHKMVSFLKTRLAPARDESAAVIANIFNLYTQHQLSVTEIAQVLNSKHIPSPHHATWRSTGVKYILMNPRYAGIAHHRSWRPGVDPIEVREAYDKVVPLDVYEAAQTRLAAGVPCAKRTRARLLDEANAAQAAWGHLSADLIERMLTASKNFTDSERTSAAELLSGSFMAAIDEERTRIRRVLETRMRVSEAGDGFIVNDVLTVSFAIGWQRHDLERKPVEFDLRAVRSDVVICLGCTGAPMFNILLRCTSTRSLKRRVTLRHLLARSTRLPAFSSDAQLLRRISAQLYVGNERANTLLISKAQKHDRISYKKLARELGWPTSAVRLGLDSAERKGEPLPEVMYDKGRRVSILCPRCGSSRELTPGDARLLKTPLCGSCTRHRPVHKLAVVCPLCAAVRHVWPSALKKLAKGSTSLCHSCTLAAGRVLTASRNKQRRPLLIEKANLLHAIGLLVFRLMTQRTAEFCRPTLCSLTRRRRAVLQWSAPKTNEKHLLTLDCDDAFIGKCRMADGQGRRGELAEAIMDRSRWLARGRDSRGNVVWLVHLR